MADPRHPPRPEPRPERRPAPHAGPLRAANGERSELVRSLALESVGALRAVQHLAQRAFEPIGLSPSQVLVLLMIHKGVDQPKRLAQQLDTVQSAVSALLGELQGRGLIDRAADPADRRRARLQLTPSGEETLSGAAAHWFAATEDRLAGVSLADLQATARVMRLLMEGAAP